MTRKTALTTRLLAMVGPTVVSLTEGLPALSLGIPKRLSSAWTIFSASRGAIGRVVTT